MTTERFERVQDGGGHLPGPADRTPNRAHMSQRIRERTQTAARKFGGDAPDHRANQHSGCLQRICAEVLAHDVGCAATTPAQQGGQSGAPPVEHLASETAERRRVVGCIEHQSHGWHRGLHVLAVGLGLGRVIARDGLDGLVDGVVAEPRRPTAPGHVHLRGIDLQVLQTVLGK